MWKKPELNVVEPEQPKPVERPRTVPAEPPSRSSSGATIGPSIDIHGDVTGKEDLVIQGRVEGKVDLKQNQVTVGTSGRVTADISARTITVEGEVDGNLYGDERVIVRRSGRVRGNIVAPRISLEDGASFNGSIDMEPKASVHAAKTTRDFPASSGTPKLKSVDEPERASGSG